MSTYVTIKVRRATVIAFAVSGFAIGFLIGYDPGVATIGDNDVPALHCEEDEVIAFDHTSTEVPRPLACVHPDNLYR